MIWLWLVVFGLVSSTVYLISVSLLLHKSHLRVNRKDIFIYTVLLCLTVPCLVLTALFVCILNEFSLLFQVHLAWGIILCAPIVLASINFGYWKQAVPKYSYVVNE